MNWLWLWKDSDKKIMLQADERKRNQPIRDLARQLDKRVQDLMRVTRIQKFNSDYEKNNLLRDIDNLNQTIEDGKLMYSNVLGEKGQAEANLYQFKMNAYNMLKKTSKYVLETNPLDKGDILKTDISQGNVYFAENLNDIEKILNSKKNSGGYEIEKFKPKGTSKGVNLPGLNEKFKIRGNLQKEWPRLINKTPNNPLKGEGFVFENNNQTFTVTENKPNLIFNKNKIFGKTKAPKFTYF